MAAGTLGRAGRRLTVVTAGIVAPHGVQLRGQESLPDRRGERNRAGHRAATGPRRAELYLTDINADGLAQTVADVRALGARVPAHRALDIADYHEVAHLAVDIHTHHGAMDIVCNIAGISAWGTVDHLTHQHWRSMIDVNLMGPVHVIETFLPPMMARAAAAGWSTCPRRRDWSRCRGTRRTAPASSGCAGCRRCSGSISPGTASGLAGGSGRGEHPLVDTVHIAGVDRDHPQVQRLVRLFTSHAVPAEKVADKILAGIARTAS